MTRNDKIVKLACYTTNISMAVVSNITPLLFLTFRSLYGISYSLLGLLVLINFCTQLTIDLIFSFFSHKFNIAITVKLTPVLTVIGLAMFAVAPVLFPSNVYVGLVIGTVVFSLSGGLSEVLISPVLAALPLKDPDREMSMLHSIYAWGVVGVVIFSTVFLLVFQKTSWQYLILVLTVLPMLACVFFFLSKVPEMKTPEKTSGALKFVKNKGVWLCVFAIFLGGASECTMAQWASGYIENSLGIDKVWGDIFGVALFGAMLGLGRSLYGKIGKNIEKVLLVCAVGATFCYLLAAIVPVPWIALAACALTGLCTSMLWPGSLIVASDKYPEGGVMIFALMAAGGDLGASVGPQLVGVIADKTMTSNFFIKFAAEIGLTAEQLGLKLGMLVGMIFPLIAIFVFITILRLKNKGENTQH